MINSLTDLKKSAGLTISCPPNRDANDSPVLGISTHPNLRGSNQKKERQSWNYRSVRCHHYTANDKRILQGLMYRRQVLLASTSLPFNHQQMMMAAMPPPPNFTDYHKLANAVQTPKFMNSPHGRTEINDVVSWPLKPSNSRSADEVSGVVGVSLAQEQLHVDRNNEKEVVTARVRRPAAFKERLHKEEEVVLEGIQVRDDKPLCFDVYIRLREVEDEEEEIYLGTFSHMPPRQKQRGRQNSKAVSDGREEQKRVRRCCLRLGMNDMLIDADEAESVTVKLVPTMKVEEDPIKVESIFIDYT